MSRSSSGMIGALLVLDPWGHRSSIASSIGRNGSTRMLTVTGLPSRPQRRLTAADEPHQGDQDAGADEGDDDAAPESGRTLDEEARDQPAQERADEPHDDIADDAEAAALH